MHIGQVMQNADDFPHIPTRQLFAHTKSTTLCSPFLHIKPLKHPVFSVCPIYNRLYPCSYVTSLSLIIFKIIPHPMTLLTAFLLQVIILYLILYCLFSLAYCRITYPLPSSHILSPRVHLTRHLNPFSWCERCTPIIHWRTRSSPPLVLLHISTRNSSKALVLRSCLSTRPHSHPTFSSLYSPLLSSFIHVIIQSHQHSSLSTTIPLAYRLPTCPIITSLTPMLPRI
jgi:hypothetical protein